MNLPEDFLLSMKEILQNEYDEFVNSYDEDSVNGLRVNTAKISVDEFVKIAPYKIEPIPFIENGFYIDEKDLWTKHPYYFAGLYYIQEPSAMLPANILPVEDGDIVLDLCAAPGGKSSELATKAKCKLIANDISFSRTIPLVKNIEMTGASNVYVTCEAPSKLKIEYKDYFDKILVDAPCSGEGMFRKDKGLIKEYQNRKPRDYSVIQKEIIMDAACMCKPGGKLLYSTCTFSALEDEEVIKYLLEERDDFRLLDVKDIKGASSGYGKYVDKIPELEKCIHIFPHRVKGEGHFVALLERKEENVETIDNKATNKKDLIGFDKLPKDVVAFCSLLSSNKQEELKKALFIMKDNMIFMINNDFAYGYRKNLHYTRTGSFIGTVGKNGGFTPYTGFALSLKSEDFINKCDFSSKEAQIIKYLKGETIILQDCKENTGCEKGYVLILVDGFAVGFAKSDGIRLKNLYEKGWRLN